MLLVLALALVMGQAVERIVDIRVQGNTLTVEADIVRMAGVQPGTELTPQMLDEVAAFYDAEAEVKLEQLTTLLEPLILVVMAAIVLAILLAIYLPIIQTITAGPVGGSGR